MSAIIDWMRPLDWAVAIAIAVIVGAGLFTIARLVWNRSRKL